MSLLSLNRRRHELALAARQRELLESDLSIPTFEEALRSSGFEGILASDVEILQVNVGKLCNQTCRHCHVDAGPDRRESMTRETMQACLDLLARSDIGKLDITGGAPEMHPDFRWLVGEARRLGRRVIDRCNLTILVAPGFQDLPEFLAEHEVEIVASLPCYLEENADAQRGDGVFRKSIEALRRLNSLGYGSGDERRRLTLVYNPIGPSLPPDQSKLEADYRRELLARYDVRFDRLFALANLPISRFLDDLVQSGRYEAYLEKLVAAFNPATLDGLMCRNTLSVDWQGRLFDCDFNQMLDLEIGSGYPQSVIDLDVSRLSGRPISTGRHCFGCTAGCGSSCGGSILKYGG